MTATIAEGRPGARLRAAVDRLYGAQVAALAGGAAGVGSAVGEAGVVGAAGTVGVAGAADPRDAYAAGRELLESVGELGSLLAGLARPGCAEAGDADDAAVRRRVVGLAVAGANLLAEVASLAFEVEGAGRERRASADDPGEAAPQREVAAGAARGAMGSAPLGARTSMRAVTDMHTHLIGQLKRLMRHLERRESWRSARPGELWRGLV